MVIKPHRTKHLMTVGFAMAVIAIISMVFSIATSAELLTQKTITRTVIQTKEVVWTTDQERIQLFIDELLNSKSAACFRAILKKETHGYNPKAVNPASGASGIGQLLDSTYRNLGLQKTNDPLAQVVATLAYVARHYGGTNSTCAAWAYWKRNSSY